MEKNYLDYGKQAYVKCEDLENQFNYLKQKMSQGSSQTNCSMVKIGGNEPAVGNQTKEVTLSVPANKEFTLQTQLNIIYSTTDEFFECLMFFDDTLISCKSFAVVNGIARVYNETKYTSTNGQVKVKFSVCPGTATTSFCIDGVVVVADTQSLTYNCPNNYTQDRNRRLSMTFMTDKNPYNLPNSYCLAFNQDDKIYYGYASQKYFDMKKINMDSMGDCRDYSVGVTVEYPGAVTLPVANRDLNDYIYGDFVVSYHAAEDQYIYTKYLTQTKSNTVNRNFTGFDKAPYVSKVVENYDEATVIKHLKNKKISYMYLVENLYKYYNYIEVPDFDLIEKTYIGKPTTLPLSHNLQPLAVVDKYKVAMIAYDHTYAKQLKYLTIENVDELYMVYDDPNTLHVYASINNQTYLYELVYDSTTNLYTIESQKLIGNYDMVYPGMDNDVFFLKNNKIYFSHNKDLVLC